MNERFGRISPPRRPLDGYEPSLQAAVPPLTDDEWEALRRRLGDALLTRRIGRQARYLDLLKTRRRRSDRLPYASWPVLLTDAAFRLTGLYRFGRRSYQDVQVVHNTLALPDLPAALDGYTILQITDLHVEVDPQLIDIVISRLDGLRYDVCVFTGDFRAANSDDGLATVAHMARLLPHITGDAYAILGNHDFIESVPYLEGLGLPFLLNESVVLRHGGGRLALAGIDDPYYFRTHDVAATAAGLPDDAVRILLAHSPEVYRQADAAGFHVMLAGHTHGGQLCLPGRIPLFANVDCPREMIAGAWSYGGLLGYTSPGTGGGGVPLRLFCPPEITLHTLRALPA